MEHIWYNALVQLEKIGGILLTREIDIGHSFSWYKTGTEKWI